MRTGNPCSSGSGSPFISTASIASRPSITTAAGLPTVNPSTERETSWSAAGSTPASSSKGFSGTPTQRALPMYGPPTSFETHVSVMSRSIRSPSDELLEVQRDLPIDHAVDPQRPVLGTNRGHEQGGVDAVELVVRRDERAEPGDTQLGAGRRRRRDVHRLRDLEGSARLIGGEPPREELSRGARRECRAHRGEATQQEPTSFDPDRGRRLRIVRMLLRQAGVQEDQRAALRRRHPRATAARLPPTRWAATRRRPSPAARRRRGRSSRRSGCGPRPSPGRRPRPRAPRRCRSAAPSCRWIRRCGSRSSSAIRG